MFSSSAGGSERRSPSQAGWNPALRPARPQLVDHVVLPLPPHGGCLLPPIPEFCLVFIRLGQYLQANTFFHIAWPTLGTGRGTTVTVRIMALQLRTRRPVQTAGWGGGGVRWQLRMISKTRSSNANLSSPNWGRAAPSSTQFHLFPCPLDSG